VNTAPSTSSPAWHIISKFPLRRLTPLGLAYEKAVERYAPYNRIIQRQPRMRKDTVDLVTQATDRGVSTYVLVNNRSEGCSPMTVQEILDQLAALQPPAL